MKYSEEVKKHFMNPKNMGEIENADSIGKAGNIACGDIMWLYLKVKKERIEDIKFKTLGCAAAIAASSITTELAKGKKLQDAMEISDEQVVNSLGGLPPMKKHCSVLASGALTSAIYNYFKNCGRLIPHKLEKKYSKVKEELQKTEKRYKGFVEKQKEMLE